LIDFLRWLTVAKKKNSLIEKARVSLLENLHGWLGHSIGLDAYLDTSPPS